MNTTGGTAAAEKGAAHGAANAGTQPKPQTERASGTTEATAARSETSGVQLHGPTGIFDTSAVAYGLRGRPGTAVA